LLAAETGAAVCVCDPCQWLPPFGALALLDILFCITAALNFELSVFLNPCDRWVPVATAWRVLRLRMHERPPTFRVAANILNKRSRTADKGCSSSLGVGRGANNSSLLKRILLRNIHRQSLGPGLVLWYDLSNGRGT